jgi:hypothetical protein
LWILKNSFYISSHPNLYLKNEKMAAALNVEPFLSVLKTTHDPSEIWNHYVNMSTSESAATLRLFAMYYPGPSSDAQLSIAVI